jgi:hypothetical protein
MQKYEEKRIKFLTTKAKRITPAKQLIGALEPAIAMHSSSVSSQMPSSKMSARAN